jgi:integrase
MSKQKQPNSRLDKPNDNSPVLPSTMPTFADVKAAVSTAPDLSQGTRLNLLRAVDLVAQQMGPAGLSAALDIQRIARRFEKVTPATLGFASAGSLASLLSNFRRALRIAGVTVMPGKSHNPLGREWAALRERAEPIGCWPAVSRFAHWASERELSPAAIADEHVEQFLRLIRETSLKSRADGARRKLIKAWQRAQANVPGWPAQQLSMPHRRRAEGAPDWSAYPPSLKADAQAFVERDCLDEWLSFDASETRRSSQPLRPATRANYIGAIRRAAGELVAAGVAPEELRSLADLAQPERVRTILKRIAARTGRRSGSAIGQTAVVLLLIGRDHARFPEAEVAKLKALEKRVRAERRMGDRTHDRLVAMDDERRLRGFLNLPYTMMREAERRGTVDPGSARLARCALFLQLLIDTGMRQGNVVGLNMDKHLRPTGGGGLTIMVEGEAVKNGQEVVAPLRRDTVRMVETYASRYRPIHAGQAASPWLFPRPDGSHWTTVAANQALQDLTAKHLGFPINPHLVRSLLLEILDREHPGAIALGRDVLGHKSIATTEAHYARRQTARARHTHQAALECFRSRR